MAFTLGLSVTAVVGGYAIQALGYRAVFSLGALLVVASTALFWAWFIRGRGKAASPSDRSGWRADDGGCRTVSDAGFQVARIPKSLSMSGCCATSPG